MSRRPGVRTDDLWTNNSSLVVPRSAPGDGGSPAGAVHPPPPQQQREDLHPCQSTAQAGWGPSTPPKDSGDLRFTESSDDYAGYLTKEQLERHKRQYREEPGVVGEENVIAEYPGEAALPSPRTLPQRIKWLIARAKRSLVFFRERVKAMTWKQRIWVSFLVLLVTAGNAMQILMLNFWLDIFEEAGISGNYTAFAVPGILFSLFFIIALAVYVAVRRPNMKFASHRYGWQLLIGVGFCDTFNSWLATYAASHTSEVLQALFTNLCPLYAVFMSKWILHDPRTYLNSWIIAVFVLTIVGILIASVYGIVVSGDMGEGKIWIFIFFLSIPFRVLMNVWQSLYMIVYTRDPAFTEWLGRYFWRGPRHPGAEDHNTPALAGRKRLGGDDADSTSPGVPFQLDGGLAEHIVLSSLDGGEREGSARMMIAPPPSACASEPLEDREQRYLSANVSFGQQQQQQPRSNGEPRFETLPPFREASRATRSDTGPRSVTAPAPQPQPIPQEIVSIRYHQGEDMIVKLVMLAGETTAQICFTLSLLPADALPWWGNSKTVNQSWTNFVEGIVCVFTVRNNFIFGFLYTLGFVFTYIGCAYLNHYSVALCSIVSQLSSPLTALLLVLVPSWNVQGGGDSPWYMSAIAIVLLSLAAFIYVVWEEQTDAEKVEGERVLKMKKLRVRPLESDNTVPLADSVGI